MTADIDKIIQIFLNSSIEKAVAEEREECAKVAQAEEYCCPHTQAKVAAAIRGRK